MNIRGRLSSGCAVRFVVGIINHKSDGRLKVNLKVNRRLTISYVLYLINHQSQLSTSNFACFM